MKLSEAIRLGAMLKPQGYGDASSSALAPATCAMGAAAQAVGNEVDSYQLFYKEWPFTYKLCVACPASDIDRTQCVLSQVHRLNDHYRWTRERIADWVATIEAQHPEFDAPAELSTQALRVAEPALKGGE